MFSFIQSCFSWLPFPLFVLVKIVQYFFMIAVLFKILRIVLDLAKMVISVFGGAIAKVASWFL